MQVVEMQQVQVDAHLKELRELRSQQLQQHQAHHQPLLSSGTSALLQSPLLSQPHQLAPSHPSMQTGGGGWPPPSPHADLSNTGLSPHLSNLGMLSSQTYQQHLPSPSTQPAWGPSLSMRHHEQSWLSPSPLPPSMPPAPPPMHPTPRWGAYDYDRYGPGPCCYPPASTAGIGMPSGMHYPSQQPLASPSLVAQSKIVTASCVSRAPPPLPAPPPPSQCSSTMHMVGQHGADVVGALGQLRHQHLC